MLSRIRSHLRQNVVAYIALFFALGGTSAYATHLVVRSSDIVDNQVRTADVRNDNLSGGGLTGTDIANATSGSDAINADELDGLNSDDFASSAELHSTQRQAVDDPTPSDPGSSQTPLFSSGGVEVVGLCGDDLKSSSAPPGSGTDFAGIRVRVFSDYSFSTIRSDPLESINDEQVQDFQRRDPVSVSATDASASNLVESAYFVVVAESGEVVSGLVSAELNDTGGAGSDCTFGATGIG